MAREAFARARRFLQFQRSRSLAALIAGAFLGVVYLGYLGTAGLVTDLLATQGRLAPDQGQLLERWLGTHFPAGSNELRQAFREGKSLGLVSLAVRHQDDWYGGLYSVPARSFAWTWKPFTYLTGLIAILIFLGLVHFAVALLMYDWAVQSVLDAAYRLRRTVYLHSLRLGRLALPGQATGEAVGTFSRDLEAVQEGLFNWLTVTYKEPIKFVLVLLFALLVDSAGGIPWLTLTTVVLAVLVWLLGGWVGTHYRKEERAQAAAAAEQMTLMREALSITRLVKGFGMDAFNQNRVERQLHAYGMHLNRRLMTRVRSRLALQTFAVLGVAALVYVAGWSLLTGQNSWAHTVTVLLALLSLYPPLRRLLQRQKIVEQARRSAASLFKFLDTEGDVRQVVGAEFLAPMTTSLEFDQVTLKLPGRAEPLLDRVSFKINAGERVAFVGQEEQALRAIAYLIPRFVDPSSGEIRIDGRRLPWMTLESIRAQVGLVMQEDLVFGDSILNNIACGDPSFTLPKVIEAAKAAHAHQFIMNLAAGYDTPIGELGESLDDGERFRIALARVILRDPALVIIEEPPHTALDEATKAIIDDAVDRFLVGRTALFLPHRQSTTSKCSRVYLLHEGRLEAVGTHRDLLLKSERYRHLQYLEFNVFAEES